jgi:hypothetical protein
VEVLEVGEPGDRVRVLGPDGQPLPRLRVELRRGERAVFTGTTSPFGVLAHAPHDLSGLSAVAEGVAPTAVDAANRTVVLAPAERAE